MTAATVATDCPPWCTNGASGRCDHAEHWSDDLMIYTAASRHAAEPATEIGLPAQVGAGPAGREDGSVGVVIHADNHLGDTEVHLTVAEAREFARHVLLCADTVDPAGVTT